MDVIIIVGKKRSKQLGVVFFFFLFLQPGSWSKDVKKPDSCRSKSCTLILGHAGRTVANLGIKKLAIAPLNCIKSSSYLLLPINVWIYYERKRRAGSQGWERTGRGGTLLVRTAITHGSSATRPPPAPASPHRSLSDPEKPLLSRGLLFPRDSPLLLTVHQFWHTEQ